MTSKEKLDYIINTIPYIDQDVKLANNYAKDIGKDLEIVDILKEKLYYDNKNHVIKMKEIRKSRFNFDYEDLKKWLEN